jgi:hypothetical protein
LYSVESRRTIRTVEKVSFEDLVLGYIESKEQPGDARIFGIVRRFLVERGQDGRVDGDDRIVRGLLSRAVSRSPHHNIHESQGCNQADVDYISRFGCRLKEARRR